MIAPRLTLVVPVPLRAIAACDCGWFGDVANNNGAPSQALSGYRSHLGTHHGPRVELSLSTEDSPMTSAAAAEEAVQAMIDLHCGGGYWLSSPIAIGRTPAGEYLAYATMAKAAR